jgi:predicted DNA-binding mobile mystery protein A
MARTTRNPEFLALQRKQLDAKLMVAANVQAPRDGWIRTIRTALGMSAAQLGRRLGVSQQEATDLERRERSGSITLSTLAKAAEALDCDLQVTFVPKTSLDEAVKRQAAAKALAERNRVLHTMRLEAQDEGVDDALAQRHGADHWLTSRVATLWD